MNIEELKAMIPSETVRNYVYIQYALFSGMDVGCYRIKGGYENDR